MRYVALFRGINVGKRNAVKMDELRKLFEELGFTGVSSYIQSGNILFDSDHGKEEIRGILLAGFARHFGFEAGIHLRNRKELAKVVESLPFTKKEILAAEASDPTVAHLYVYFLDQPIGPEQLDVIRMEYDGFDQIATDHSEIYFLTHQGMRQSRMPSRIVKTFAKATSRNWSTITRLLELMDGD